MLVHALARSISNSNLKKRDYIHLSNTIPHIRTFGRKPGSIFSFCPKPFKASYFSCSVICEFTPHIIYCVSGCCIPLSCILARTFLGGTWKCSLKVDWHFAVDLFQICAKTAEKAYFLRCPSPFVSVNWPKGAEILQTARVVCTIFVVRPLT